MTKINWIQGDSHPFKFPAHAEALVEGGEDFLTRAFLRSGVFSETNAVTRIVYSQEIFGGSTGRKMLLEVEYRHAEPHLHRRLFVKFSRDFDDARRDAARVQMDLEVRFALLSQTPGFPITVPTCYFADFHRESGTGILITQCIPYGENGVEPQYEKGLDHTVPHILDHYRSLVQLLARLAGSHRGGRLSDRVAQLFPFEPDKLTVSVRKPYTPDQIRERVEHTIAFIASHPQLFPEHLRAEEFFERLRIEAPTFQSHQDKVGDLLQSRPEMIALCHWNAHIDNAWFWREGGELRCGLLDWGNVSQMNVAVALWGCLSAAELWLWDEHLDELLTLFADTFQASGGGALDKAVLRQHLVLNVAFMGLAWMLDAPRSMLASESRLAQAKDARDPLVTANERVRSQLLILKAFLNLWQGNDMRAHIDALSSLKGE